MHLLAPHGRNINDAVDPPVFTLHYVTVDDTAHLVAKHAAGVVMPMKRFSADPGSARGLASSQLFL